MIIDQAEIDALLSATSNLIAETDAVLAQPPPTAPAAGAPARPLPEDPELARIRRIRVPVIVQLARRSMAIAAVRNLSVGAIIEFEKSVEEPLDLLINNRLVGRGTCVKVGENFGLRITQICNKAQRIRSLGKA